MKGILFKPVMIEAIAELRKTQTRRVIKFKPFPNIVDSDWHAPFTGLSFRGGWKFTARFGMATRQQIVLPRYKIGEVVYIKEPWHYLNIEENKATPYDFGIEFADGEILWWTDNGNEMNYPLDEKKRSPMFLKAKFARYFLRIKDVRPERLQEITEEDAEAEGVTRPPNYSLTPHYIEWYKWLWNKINPKYRWASNPWTWRYEFDVAKAGG